MRAVVRVKLRQQHHLACLGDTEKLRARNTNTLFDTLLKSGSPWLDFSTVENKSYHCIKTTLNLIS